MLNELYENDYIVVRNLITYDTAVKLSKKYTMYCLKNNIGGDRQNPECSAFSSEAKFVFDSSFKDFIELHKTKTKHIADILDLELEPSFCYARMYKHGSVLVRHTDRYACEIAVSLHLDGDTPWELHIETPKNTIDSVILEPGDAMIMFGRKARHWRNYYEGIYYNQLMLFYHTKNYLNIDGVDLTTCGGKC